MCCTIINPESLMMQDDARRLNTMTKNIELTDTHCHFDFPPFDQSPAVWLKRAQDVGVTRLIVPAVSSKNWQAVTQLSQSFPDIYCAIGLHPRWQASHQESDFDALASALSEAGEKCVALGECGLDFSFAKANRAQQIHHLLMQFELASQLNLPVILHCLKAHNEMLQCLNQFPKLRGVLHAFHGSESLAHEFIRRGFLLGIGGTITYPRANKTRQTVARLPLEAMVLETDSPDMPLMGCQGQANTPEQLPNILKVLANLRAQPVKDIAHVIQRNTTDCFFRDEK